MVETHDMKFRQLVTRVLQESGFRASFESFS